MTSWLEHGAMRPGSLGKDLKKILKTRSLRKYVRQNGKTFFNFWMMCGRKPGRMDSHTINLKVF